MLDPAAFPIERATVREGVELAYLRAGAGGFPLLLVHGWPETMRIWWRNVGALADAGFEVIVPDLRGFGLTGPVADGHYDMAASARDLRALMVEVLGHERCAAAGGDYGGVVIQDLGLRFEGLVVRQCLFNTVLPLLGDAYEAAGISPAPPPHSRAAADDFVRQGTDADALAAELDTPERRRRYVAGMYGHRFWGAPGAFDEQAVDFMTEPFADGATLRASFGLYEAAMGTREPSEPPRFFEPNPIETLVLYGPEDHVIWPDFAQRAEVALPRCVGPFVVPGAGHFLQWERAQLFNRALVAFLRDLRTP